MLPLFDARKAALQYPFYTRKAALQKGVLQNLFLWSRKRGTTVTKLIPHFRLSECLKPPQKTREKYYRTGSSSGGGSPRREQALLSAVENLHEIEKNYQKLATF